VPIIRVLDYRKRRMRKLMGSRAGDQRVIHNHPFCALCGSHMGLTVEREPPTADHTVLSTVTGTTHDVNASRSGPRVVCDACHQAWLAETGG
jgi:hypothetical protein